MRGQQETTAPRLALATVLLLVLPGCGPGGDVREITKERTYEPVGESFAWNAGPEERFRVRMPGSEIGAGAPATAGLHWDTPPGWQELPTSNLRQANFRVAGDEQTECYLTVLPGDGGGIAANINRWRKQMSLPPAEPAEIEALPRMLFFGAAAFVVDVEGTWTGMRGDQEGTGYRLVGLAQVVEGTSRFLKLIGPKSVVDAELEAFKTLAASFHVDTHPHGTEAPETQPTPPPTPEPTATARGGSGFFWTKPEGWEIAPDKPMRAVTFTVGGDGITECYVVVLGGTGGGLSANINRWCDQMGAPELNENQIAVLPRIPMLGREGVFVETAGQYTGMGDENVPDALLYGVVCLLPQSSVFVKMTGPRSTMEGARDAFLEFCKSMELEG